MSSSGCLFLLVDIGLRENGVESDGFGLSFPFYQGINDNQEQY